MSTGSVRLLIKPEDVERELGAAVEWADTISFCSPAADFRLGSWGLANVLLGAPKKLRHAYVAIDGLLSEPHALEKLHRLGVLRLVPAADDSFRANIFILRRDRSVRVLVGSGRLVPAGLMAPLEAMVLWEGSDSDSFALQVETLLARARVLAHVPEAGEFELYSRAVFEGDDHWERLRSIGAPFTRRSRVDDELHELELVSDASTIRSAVRRAKAQITTAATWRARQWIGFQGGRCQKTVHWNAALGVWAVFDKLDTRYWLAFGVHRPSADAALGITVEVNPPLEGLQRRIGGAVARTRSGGRLFLVHRGRIGGGQKGIGSDLFWSRFRGGVAMVEEDGEEPSRVVVVGEIGAPSFPRDVAAFVHEVRRIKQAVN